MPADVNVDGYQEDHYLARAWALLTRRQDWSTTLLVACLVSLVPFVGPLVVLGLAAEWARSIAWGISDGPRTDSPGLGTCLSSGWRAFLVVLGWSVGLGFIMGIVQLVPLIGPIVSSLGLVVSLAVGLVAAVAALRATIYQQVGAGYNLQTVFEMANDDAVGLARILGFQLLTRVAVGVAAAVIIMVGLVAAVPGYMGVVQSLSRTILSDGAFDSSLVRSVLALATSIMPAVIAAAAVSTLLSVPVELLSYAMVGLWARQFNVPAWGRETDPLPQRVPPTRPYVAYQQPPQQPGGVGQYGQGQYGQDQYGQGQYGGSQYGQAGAQYSQPMNQYGQPSDQNSQAMGQYPQTTTQGGQPSDQNSQAMGQYPQTTTQSGQPSDQNSQAMGQYPQTATQSGHSGDQFGVTSQAVRQYPVPMQQPTQGQYPALGQHLEQQYPAREYPAQYPAQFQLQAEAPEEASQAAIPQEMPQEMQQEIPQESSQPLPPSSSLPQEVDQPLEDPSET